jgi:hypothetical protein
MDSEKPRCPSLTGQPVARDAQAHPLLPPKWPTVSRNGALILARRACPLFPQKRALIAGLGVSALESLADIRPVVKRP